MKTLLAACLLTLVATATAEDKAIVPLRPAQLLQALPKPDPDWKLSASTAQDIPNAWPRSKASREYTTEVVDPASGAKTTVKTKLTIIDTGGFPDSLQRFIAAPDAESAPAGQKFTLASMPAFRRNVNSETQAVDALALNRFLILAQVQIKTTPANAPAASNIPGKGALPETWVEKVNLAFLRDAARNEKRLDPEKDHSMIVEKMDELNPKLSTKTSWSFAVEEQKDE